MGISFDAQETVIEFTNIFMKFSEVGWGGPLPMGKKWSEAGARAAAAGFCGAAGPDGAAVGLARKFAEHGFGICRRLWEHIEEIEAHDYQ
jgi:hypothetical protein